MKSTLETHKNILKNNKGSVDENLAQFIERFKESTSGVLFSNSLFYALDLNKMVYAYVSPNSEVFTGKSTSDFYRKGMDILLNIMVAEDLEVLSKLLFPKMQSAYQSLDTVKREKAVFEIYYRFKHAVTEKITSVVEYSSYARFNPDGEPVLSTGVIYESPVRLPGVRGIVRTSSKNGLESVFDEIHLHHLEELTKTERKITELFLQRNDRTQIAFKLNISAHTVKTHFKNIYKKLGLKKEADLITYFNSN